MMTTPALWLLDLDDTLFEASGGMLRAIHVRMNAYICRELGVNDEEASALRTAYWARYGATFLGLWLHHRIDPTDFLKAAHNFDPSPFIRYMGSPAADIARLKGRKVLFTNGPRNYAEAVLKCLGLTHAFDGVVTSTDMKALGRWRPKPDALMLQDVCRRYGVRPSEAVLVDDSPMNLRCAHGVGLKTVWCTGSRRRHGRLDHPMRLLYVDAVVSHIRALSRLHF